jgi:ParB family chromosome partitioning protein
VPIHESTTNPRHTFERARLEELAESIRQHGLIQLITVPTQRERLLDRRGGASLSSL